MRPIHYVLKPTMLHRIPMDILDRRWKSASSRIWCSQKRRCHTPRSPRFCRLVEIRSPFSIEREKIALMRPPSYRKVGIIWRQSPYAMQMVRQNHYSVNSKRMSGFNRLKSVTQTIDVFHQKLISFSFSQKPCSSWHVNAAVISHCSSSKARNYLRELCGSYLTASYSPKNHGSLKTCCSF